MQPSLSGRIAALLILIALFIDVLEAYLASTFLGIPAALLLDLLAWAGFSAIFYRLGIPRSVSFSAVALVELIPGVGALPFWSAYVVGVVIRARTRART